jgi:alpha-D-xyloside xylohydrolase
MHGTSLLVHRLWLLAFLVEVCACAGGSRGGGATGSAGQGGGNAAAGQGGSAAAGASGLGGASGGAPSGAAGGAGAARDAGALPTDGGDAADAPVVAPPPDPVLTLKNGALRLEVWGERTIRVVFGTTAPAPNTSLAVTQMRPVTPFTIDETATALSVVTSKLRARVDKTSGQVTFLDPTGAILVAESASSPHQLATTTGPGPFKAVGAFASQAGEHFYGLGQHQQSQQGKMAYSGSVQLLQRNPGESSVPVLVSSGGYGLLWDNPSVTTVDFTNGISFTSEAATLLDYYFMAGGADDVVASYRALTGQAPLFGRWAYGYWQSKDHYGSQSELLNVASTYRSMQIPIDDIVQDWTYWGSNPWGSHQFDASYPDPAGMFKTLHDTGFHAMISVWARFAAGSDNYTALEAAGDFITPALSDGSTMYYDAFKADARALYWQQINTALFTKGVDGWWLDATEPELNGNWGEFRTSQTSVGPGAVVYNAFPLMTTTAVHDGQRAATSDKRVFILTRSAYAGQQRNAAVTWSGDITGDWATFKRQIPAGLNFSLSGIPYWTTDTGGYFLSNLGGVGSAAYTELFERWLEFSTFCPIFRTHGTGSDRNLYAFGAAAQTVLVGTDTLRYRLLPYIYSQAWQVTHAASTIMRALVFDFASDPQALDVPDEYMFGPAILVSPVSDAGATSRGVYLPAATTWIDFWSGASMAGGQTVTAVAPIDHIPLFVRAGAILPLGPVVQYATEKPADPIELRVYSGANGSFTLYEDENDNYDYESGTFATIPMSWNDATKTLTIGARTGSFPGMPANRTFRVVFVGPNHGTGIAETSMADATIAYTGATMTLVRPQ